VNNLLSWDNKHQHQPKYPALRLTLRRCARRAPIQKGTEMEIMVFHCPRWGNENQWSTAAVANRLSRGVYNATHGWTHEIPSRVTRWLTPRGRRGRIRKREYDGRTALQLPTIIVYYGPERQLECAWPQARRVLPRTYQQHSNARSRATRPTETLDRGNTRRTQERVSPHDHQLPPRLHTNCHAGHTEQTNPE